MTVEEKRINRRITELGEHYWQRMQGEMPSLFDSRYWQGHILDWIMDDEAFKIDAFRFVDVLPALRSTSAIASHVQDYLLGQDRKLPVLVRSALSMASGGIAAPLAARAIRANISEMARRFICESDSKKAIPIFKKLGSESLTFTADILGEASSSDEEAERYLENYLTLIVELGQAAKGWPDNAQLYSSSTGQLPKANVSVKISALDPYLDAMDHHGSMARLQERLLPLLRAARRHNVFINFDLEQWACHDITYDLFEQMALHPDLVDWPHLGLVVQAYLKSSASDCNRLLGLSKRRGTPFTVRLVKGAYWDYEVVHARQNGFICPVYTNKGRTDLNYEALTVKLVENQEFICPAFASHNLRSLVHALIMAEEHGLPANSFELQMLYGMAEPQRRVLAEDGYRLRVYAPIGELLPGMAYLVRRLLENTSNSGFLRQSYHEGVAIRTMLQPPDPGPGMAEREGMVSDDLQSIFRNTDLLDFTDSQVRRRMSEALEAINERLPVAVPHVIAGKVDSNKNTKKHVSPNDSALVVSEVSQVTRVQARKALAVAQKAFPAWRDRPVAERAQLLATLAGILERDRFELAALQSYEVGKPWREADADVAEAIDFCSYYARQAIKKLSPQRQGDMAGEENILFYEGRGPCAVISPWNFPLAILCGMTSAALVCGNTVLVKPAGAASAIAFAFYQRLLEAGFPTEVVQFLPGSGGDIGSFLVEHPDICQIAFTGSKEVGLGIIEKAAKTLPGQSEVKRVVCEMGGKNAIIVDEDADIDAAIKGVMQSAFGYAGQKCSACSRLILVGDVWQSFLPRLLAACASLPMASALDPVCRLGPVIDQAAHKRLSTVIAKPPTGATLLFLGKSRSPGFFIPPAVFEVRDSDNDLMQQEFFGPIVTVIRVADFKSALVVANSSEFALSGGVYSRSPRNMETARRNFKVGNLYINRACTGALVQRQPFGGFGMSGTGTKAGGPEYLLNFSHPRCVTENTMRSGFTPDLQM
ncbi:MAG: proline dehydrogenase family protein [Proteobacteria bacterium]|nr:proline dehydrogenase family protein [Pseudomonadota bacterium]MBU1058758.1 proline dehydrogenase family protein [Pseudomonadota bacterium]